MQIKRIACIVWICILAAGVLAVPVSASEATENVPQYTMEGIVTPFATNSFSMTIGANATLKTTVSFPLTVGEGATIKASYSPFAASVDFGLVDSDGVFHYVNITDGNIDQTIWINKSGDYTLQIRNNASYEVEVSGFVNY